MCLLFFLRFFFCGFVCYFDWHWPVCHSLLDFSSFSPSLCAFGVHFIFWDYIRVLLCGVSIRIFQCDASLGWREWEIVCTSFASILSMNNKCMRSNDEIKMIIARKHHRKKKIEEEWWLRTQCPTTKKKREKKNCVSIYRIYGLMFIFEMSFWNYHINSTL